MRYTRFCIKNFKGINSTTIDLGSKRRVPLTTLIGLNESGKTTLLEAINSFDYGAEDISHLDIYGYRTLDPFDLIPIAQRSNFNDTISVESDIELEQTDIDALRIHMRDTHQWTCVSVSKSTTVAENWIFNDSTYLENKSRRTWVISIKGRAATAGGNAAELNATDPLWQSAIRFLATRIPKIWYFPNFLFDFPSRVFLENNPELQGQKAQKDLFFRGFTQAVVSEVEPKATIEKHLLARAKSKELGDRKALESLCLKIGRHLTQTVFGAWSKTVTSQLGQIGIKFLVDMDDAGRCYASIKIEDSDGFFEIGDRSLGFRWFFVFLLITQYITTGPLRDGRALLLLDEPASNLHSTAQQRLLSYFSHLSASVTLVYATHSHHLIDPSRLDSAYVVRNLGLSAGADDFSFKNTNTQIEALPYKRFVSSYPDQTAYFQPVLDILEVKPSNLEKVPSIVLVEGKSDFYLLKLLFESSKLSPSISLYPGGGAGSLDNVIALYIAWGRPFVVLLDSDTEGQKQRQRYLDRFSQDLAGRIVTFAEALSVRHFGSLESLLEADDKTALAQIAFGEPVVMSKKQILAASQSCLAEGKQLSCSEPLLGRIRDLHKFLVPLLR